MDARPERESRREVAAHPERSHRHEDAMRRYLGAALYEETRRERETADSPQPVDEPVPAVRPARRR